VNRIERIILRSKPAAFFKHKSKQIILPGFAGVPLYDVIVFFMKQIKKVGLNERASAISFNFIMALPPTFIAILTLVPYLPIYDEFTPELLRLTRDITNNQEIYNLVNNFLEDFLNTPRAGLLSFGFLLAIYYASNAMLGVIRTFDKSIYQHEKQQSFIAKRWKAIKLTLVVVALVIGMILLLVGQGWLFDQIMSWLKVEGSGIMWITTLRWIITIGLFFYGIAIIYKYAPSVKKRWHTISPGSILATFLTIVTTTGFSFWVNHFGNYNKIYGSIGTILILMLLIYFNSLILLIGFELNVSITYLKAEAEERKLKELTDLIETQVLPTIPKSSS
jgi:membrane protein